MVQAIQTNGQNLSSYGQIVEDIRTILWMQQSWMVSHVKRGSNIAIHGLAKMVLSYPNERIWMEEISSCIYDIVLLEQFALAV